MAASESFVSGTNPLHGPLALFLVQVLLIVVVSRILAAGLGYLKQPRVIAEVIGGILMGPSALSRWAPFKNNVFPDESLGRLSLVANFALIFFLYLVGLELDPSSLKQKAKASAVVSLVGIIVPFGAGAGVSKIIYENFGDPEVPFYAFFVFGGVAMSITAFPVLARILTERRLISVPVGQTTLAAAAVDDAVAWTLLVLVVALINNSVPSASATGHQSNPVEAVYVFLLVVAWAALLWFAVRPLLSKFVLKTSSEHATSERSVTVIFLLICVSAFYTQAVGVHAIFGGFLVGLITPHERGFAIKLTEKIEDLIGILLLPLYFAYSGLNTNIGSLTDATSWGLTCLLIIVACGGKVIGCGLAARLTKYNSRESLTIGFLMNTKGLVELIVLNLGYQAGVINQKVFTMFVIMALVTTFMTVPIVSAIYPMHMYEHAIVEKKFSESEEERLSEKAIEETLGVLLCIPNIETIPSMMAISQLLHSGGGKLWFRALRLIPLSDRASTLLMATTTETIHTFQADPIFKVFQTFTQLTRVGVKTTVSVLPLDEFPANIVNVASKADANIIIFPYGAGSGDKWKELVEYIDTHSRCTTAVLIDRGFGGGEDEITDENLRLAKATPAQKVCVVFQGGVDDQEVLRLAYYLARSQTVQINVLRLHPVTTLSSAAGANSEETTAESTHNARLLAPLAPFANVTVSDLALLPSENQADVIFRAGSEFGEGDLVVFGRQLYETCGAGTFRSLRTWAENECRASVLVVSAGRRGLRYLDSLLIPGDMQTRAPSASETCVCE